MNRVRHWANRLFKHQVNARPIILIGIDYPSFSLTKFLQEEAKDIRVVALIDEEPWTNKTQVHGITVYYPSDLITLIGKYQAELVVTIEGQQPELTPALVQKVATSNATLMSLPHHTTNQEQLNRLRQALATQTS